MLIAPTIAMPTKRTTPAKAPGAPAATRPQAMASTTSGPTNSSGRSPTRKSYQKRPIRARPVLRGFRQDAVGHCARADDADRPDNRDANEEDDASQGASHSRRHQTPGNGEHDQRAHEQLGPIANQEVVPEAANPGEQGHFGPPAEQGHFGLRPTRLPPVHASGRHAALRPGAPPPALRRDSQRGSAGSSRPPPASRCRRPRPPRMCRTKRASARRRI